MVTKEAFVVGIPLHVSRLEYSVMIILFLNFVRAYHVVAVVYKS